MKLKIFTLIIILSAVALYCLEATGLGFAGYKPHLEAKQVANEYILTWPRLPYLSYYEVEVLNSLPHDDKAPARPSNRITKYRTWSNHWTVNQSFPYRTYWRVSAQGLFSRPLGRYSESLSLTEVTGSTAEDFSHIKPQATSFYPSYSPAPAKPVLTWTSIAGAVYYEIEMLSRPPENPNDILPSSQQLFSSREVFTNGYNADFSSLHTDNLLWRVRALDYHGNPIGVFSDASQISINPSLQQTLKPVITVSLNEKGTAPLLYPVYSWIPIIGAVDYEVELLSQPPENPNGTAPSQYRIWSKQVVGLDCYDDLPRSTPGTYYWRVRGLDKLGHPVGVYSDAASFTVDLSKGNYAATFGDSITHGGGAVSYSPADWEYSYQTYLHFPVVNLGKSGDTSETMAARFDHDVLPYKPRFLLIMGGTNSLRGGTPATDVIHDLTVIRDKCLANGIRPILMTLPPINPAAIDRVFQEETTPNWQEEFAAVNQFIRQQRYFIDLNPYFTNIEGELPDYYAIDGLHPDIEGKKLMAQIINAHWGRVTR
jgi:lysophospholipase L1-like esterase